MIVPITVQFSGQVTHNIKLVLAHCWRRPYTISLVGAPAGGNVRDVLSQLHLIAVPVRSCLFLEWALLLGPQLLPRVGGHLDGGLGQVTLGLDSAHLDSQDRVQGHKMFGEYISTD